MSELLIRISLCEGELSQLVSIVNEPLVLTPTMARLLFDLSDNTLNSTTLIPS